jgi:hypothetical protein
LRKQLSLLLPLRARHAMPRGGGSRSALGACVVVLARSQKEKLSISSLALRNRLERGKEGMASKQAGRRQEVEILQTKCNINRERLGRNTGSNFHHVVNLP